MQRPLHNKRQTHPAWIVPAIIAAILFLGAVASNLVANYVQSRLDPYRPWVWVGFVIALVVVIAMAIKDAGQSRSSVRSDGVRPSENDLRVVAAGHRSVSIGGDSKASRIVTGDRNVFGEGFRVDGDYIEGNKIEHHLHGREITDPDFFTSKTSSHDQPFDYEIYIGSEWGDLGVEAVASFLVLERVALQEDYNTSFNAKQQFEKFRFVKPGSKPTYGTSLCFGESPNSVVAGCETRCFYWKEQTRSTGFHESELFQGNLVSQLKGGVSFLKRHLRLERDIRSEGRSEEYDVPILAIEEALANALVHREYRNRNDGVRIDLFEDRVEVVSPGGLPQQIPIELLGVEQCTYPRNPLIARVFYLYGYVEQAGTGISRMTQAMLAKNLPAPEFKAGPTNTFKVILKRAERPQKIRAPHQLPGPPADFTGRSEEIAEFVTAMENGGVTISSVHGLGGIGKTAFALKVAEQLTPRYPDAQIYLDLKGGTSKPVSTLEAMAQVIHAYHTTLRLPETEAELRGLYKSVLHGQRALLVIDDVASAEQVEPLIPPPGCVMIVTSRQHFSLAGLFAKNLDTLPPPDARKLLLTIAPRVGDQADEIAQLCGYLPLALRLAASALARFVNISPSDYKQRLKREQMRLELVQASLNLSFELLREDLRQLWPALAVFPDTFDAAAASTVWNLEIDTAQDKLSELFAVSLVEWNESISRYRLHDLVRLFANSRMKGKAQSAAHGYHSTYYANILKSAEELYSIGGESLHRGLSLFDIEWRNIQAGQKWAALHARENDDAAMACIAYSNDGAQVLSLRQPVTQRIEWLKVSLTATRDLELRAYESFVLGNLGDAYLNSGDTKRGLDFSKQHLAMAREIGDRKGQAKALGNIGIAYADLGETKSAVESLEGALFLAREIGDRRSEAAALGNLGRSLADIGDNLKAIELLETALTIARETGDLRSEGAVLGNLGRSFAELGENERAITFFEQALTIAREIGDLRGEDADLSSLGVAYADLGDSKRAIEFFERALTIAREIGEPRRESADLINLGSAFIDIDGNHAIEILEQALTIVREMGDRRSEGSALSNLGAAYANIGDTLGAIKIHEQRLSVAQELGDRRGEGGALGNLGVAYATLGETRRALDFYERALAISRDIGDRRAESNALANIGNAYMELSETKRGIPFFKQALAITRELNDRRTEGNTLFNLAEALQNVGEHNEAIAYAERALEIYEQAAEPNAEKAREQLMLLRDAAGKPKMNT